MIIQKYRLFKNNKLIVKITISYLKTIILFSIVFFATLQCQTKVSATDIFQAELSEKGSITLESKEVNFEQSNQYREQNKMHLLAQGSANQSNSQKTSQNQQNIWMVIGGVIFIIFILSRIIV